MTILLVVPALNILAGMIIWSFTTFTLAFFAFFLLALYTVTEPGVPWKSSATSCFVLKSKVITACPDIKRQLIKYSVDVTLSIIYLGTNAKRNNTKHQY